METLQHQTRIPENLDGRRLDQALAEMFPDYSRSRLKEWILAGHVLLDGETPMPRTRVRAGQAVSLTTVVEAQETARPEPMELDIVFEDDDVLVVDKPAGLVVHPGAGIGAGTLMNGLLDYSPSLSTLPRAGILHRLDKDTSGLLLVARTLKAHTHLVRDLEQRRIRREYRAVCAGRLTAGGRIDEPIGRDPVNRIRMAVVKNGRASTTHYRILARFAAHTFLAVRLETGRTHQIRVHMAHARHPLVGDPAYGGRLKIPAGASTELTTVLRQFSRQALHASNLSFRHPGKDQCIELRSPLPADFVALLQALASGDRVDGQAEIQNDGGNSDPRKWDAMRWPEALT